VLRRVETELAQMRGQDGTTPAASQPREAGSSTPSSAEGPRPDPT
jgi:hypothetical protein